MKETWGGELKNCKFHKIEETVKFHKFNEVLFKINKTEKHQICRIFREKKFSNCLYFLIYFNSEIFQIK